MRTSSTCVGVLLVLFLAAPSARAQSDDPPDQSQPQPAAQTPRPAAIEYSPGYETRAKIHKYASFATLPLVASEVLLGTSLYDDRSSSKKGAHIAVGTAITGLFAVNTVTGVWNLMEARKDPHHRTLHIVHGLLMLGADAGFVAAFGTGPSGHDLVNFDNRRSTHRTIALTSLGVAAGSYVMMLIGDR